MKTYAVQLNVRVEVDAFNSEDAAEYVQDIFNLDDEIKSLNIVSIKEK